MKLYTLEIEQYNFEYSNTGYEFFLNENEAISRKAEIEKHNYEGVTVYIGEMDFEKTKGIISVSQLEKLFQINLLPLLEKSIKSIKNKVEDDE